MSYFKFIAIGLLAFVLSGTSYATKKEEWFTLGTTGGAIYEISLNSARWMREPLSVQVLIRTKFQAPLHIGGKEVDHLIEPTLVLCNEDMVIVMSQKQIYKDGKSITYNVAVPYLRIANQDNLTSTILDLMCGTKPDSMKEPVEPPMRALPKSSVTARKIRTVV